MLNLNIINMFVKSKKIKIMQTIYSTLTNINFRTVGSVNIIVRESKLYRQNFRKTNQFSCCKYMPLKGTRVTFGGIVVYILVWQNSRKHPDIAAPGREKGSPGCEIASIGCATASRDREIASIGCEIASIDKEVRYIDKEIASVDTEFKSLSAETTAHVTEMKLYTYDNINY